MELLLTFVSLLIIAFWVMAMFSKSRNSSVAETVGDYLNTKIKASKADTLVEIQASLKANEVDMAELKKISAELGEL